MHISIAILAIAVVSALAGTTVKDNTEQQQVGIIGHLKNVFLLKRFKVLTEQKVIGQVNEIIEGQSQIEKVNGENDVYHDAVAATSHTFVIPPLTRHKAYTLPIVPRPIQTARALSHRLQEKVEILYGDVYFSQTDHFTVPYSPFVEEFPGDLLPLPYSNLKSYDAIL